MAQTKLTKELEVSLIIPEEQYRLLRRHLFPGDLDEHGAVIAASIARTERGIRLLAREVFLARDGVDYVPGKLGYRMLQPQYIYERLHFCRENKLCYLAIHNHGGENHVGFSDVDIESHERGYPALLDIQAGLPVGALVFAANAVAGDIWFPNGQRSQLIHAKVIGKSIDTLYSTPPRVTTKSALTAKYDRQLRLFGNEGQEKLRAAKVGVIGVGGVGSMLVEYLALLGLGHIVTVDEKRISKSNRARIVGATDADILNNPPTRKVEIAGRVARAANPSIVYESYFDNFAKDAIARKFDDCDFLFLAADSMQARLVFNALVQQYFIPGIQTGSKVSVDASGKLTDIFSVCRWVLPGHGCLWCNGLIPRDLLAMEAKSSEARKEQTYGTLQENPSVVTLNSVTAGHAANDFMMAFLGLIDESATIDYQRFDHRHRRVLYDQPRRDSACSECGHAAASRFGMGDAVALPTIDG